MKLMSMRITPSRQARCSASQVAHHDGRPQVSGPGAGVCPGPANQSAPSQPLTSRKYAPCSTSRWCRGETFAPRAVCSALFG